MLPTIGIIQVLCTISRYAYICIECWVPAGHVCIHFIHYWIIQIAWNMYIKIKKNLINIIMFIVKGLLKY